MIMTIIIMIMIITKITMIIMKMIMLVVKNDTTTLYRAGGTPSCDPSASCGPTGGALGQRPYMKAHPGTSWSRGGCVSATGGLGMAPPSPRCRLGPGADSALPSPCCRPSGKFLGQRPYMKAPPGTSCSRGGWVSGTGGLGLVQS